MPPSPLQPNRRNRPARCLVAALAALVIALVALPAHAQQTTGRIVGRVTEEATGSPLAGLTVVAQGAQGEDAALTDERGEYLLSSLPVGSYVVKVYAIGATTAIERPDVQVSADKA